MKLKSIKKLKQSKLVMKIKMMRFQTKPRKKKIIKMKSKKN